MSVSHLIHFQINTMLSFLNLQVLHSILPLALSNTLDYTAYYYYSKTSESDFSQLLFPYYVITENFVLEISGDLKNCILHTDGENQSLQAGIPEDFEFVKAADSVQRYA